jgi:hypothetical protein
MSDLSDLNTVGLRERVALCADFSPEERTLLLAALTAPPVLAIDAVDPPSLGFKVEVLWGAFAIDDTGEGLCAAPMMTADGLITAPLIAADKLRLVFIRKMAKKMAAHFKKPVRIAKFSQREDIEIFQP